MHCLRTLIFQNKNSKIAEIAVRFFVINNITILNCFRIILNQTGGVGETLKERLCDHVSPVVLILRTSMPKSEFIQEHIRNSKHYCCSQYSSTLSGFSLKKYIRSQSNVQFT